MNFIIILLFILIWPAFEGLRQKYIKPYYYKRPNVLKYKELFSLTPPPLKAYETKQIRLFHYERV